MTRTDPQADSIAIVGLAGRFPGARNVAEYWENLVGGKDSITHLTDDQLASAGYDPVAVRKLPGWVGARGIVEKPEWFDRAFFGISPKEAEAMDPQHRLFLEVAWDALEDAGCDTSRFPGLTGVFAGMSNNTYYSYFVQKRRDLMEAVGVVTAVISNEKDFLATRLAYKLNLHGPAVSVQTACSTSLVSVCVACRSLLNRECDAALAGGVALTFPQERGYFTQDGGMTSPDGRCAPFDARANGTVFSNGAGVVVLKRLADAVANGDQIYAVIRGHALNNDGSKKPSFAAPSDEGHSEVIAQALKNAGVTADSIGYIEAHGTATSLGDPVEIAGLSRVFRACTDAKQVCALGSVKGNIGHMDAASGISSLIKTALALRHETLPPTIHCETPNPALHLEESPFFLNTTKRAWPRAEKPRRAGVSSFGIGGTNAHVIIEEAPAQPETSTTERAQTLVISARSATALDQRASDLAAHLEKNPALPLADVALTLQAGRHIFPHRRVVVARDAAAAAAGLRAPARFHRHEDRTDTPCVLLFPGQGSQYAGMGARLHATEPVFRAALGECAEILRPQLDLDLRELIFATDEDSATLLRETRLTQPAIFSVGYALGKLWLSLGVKPAALVGHSVGEFVAATLSGIFSLEDAARLVATRARLVHDLPGGAMLAARLSEEEAREFLADPRLALAAINSPRLCVLSGPFDAVAELEATLANRNVAARRLATSHAFHSAMVESVVAPFAASVQAVKLSAPVLPIVSCVTGDWLTDAEATSAEYWAHHLRATVRFSEAVGRVLDDRGSALIEAGPGQALSQLARQHRSRTARHETIHTICEEADDDESFAAALGRLWMTGVKMDWPAVHGGELRRRVSLPGYPFERQRYFADLPPGMPMPLAIAGTDGDAPVESLAPCATPAHSLPPQIEAATPPAHSVLQAAPDSAGLLAELQHLLSDLSGIDLAAAPSSTTFLELGLDSLLLSQAALTISRKFGAKITFRQLLQETGTLELLAGHIAKHRAPAPVALSAPPAAPIAAPAASQKLTAPAPHAHGPFRPPQRDTGAHFGGAQQAWLDEFIRSYVARTKASKEYTREHRPHFADPRAVAGFRREWKEIVFPIVVERSAGANLWDIDGNEWLDLTLSFGAAMLGHQPKFVTDAITAQLARGMEIGPTSPLAGEVARLICDLTGSERAIFCNTGSEAVTGAVRAARTVTGRSKIIYFRESYHGIDNEVLGRRTGSANIPISPGMTPEAVSNTIILDYGDPRALDVIAANAADIAAVLVEPVQSRRPALQPTEFLRSLREVTKQHGIALIFDEVITGFRCHPGGAQAHFGIRADLATYGKVIGGGLPIGVIAGKAEYMDSFDGGQWNFGDDSFPEAAVTFFAGTFVRHPLALAAAHAVLSHLKEHGEALQAGLTARVRGMIEKINAVLEGSPFTAESFGSNWLVQTQPDFKFSGLLYALLRHHGLHIWEGRPCFVSTAHTDADIAKVIAALASAVKALEGAGFFSRTQNLPAAPEAITIPLTESQRELWLVCQHTPAANSACNETWALHLDGPLDAAALRASIQTIVRRHDALRSSFTTSGDTLTVADSLPIHVPSTDLSTLPEAEREACFFAMRRTESARVFDLTNAPLLALHLVRLAPDRHALIFNAHHIICDGWSCDIFLRELAEIYSAHREGRAPQLADAMQMRDYETWEGRRRTTPEFSEDSAYWLAQYRTIPPLLELPGDRPYPRERSYRGASEAVVLPPEFPQMLTRFGAAHGVTLFSVLLAGFKALLFRLSGESDLAVGVPSAGQNLADGENLIGHCVNMLPMRTQFSGSRPFAELLKSVQSGVLEAFEHQQVTFGWLLQQLSFSREPGRVPLIPVIFNLDPALTQVRFGGLEHRIESNPRSAYQFDLGFNCDCSAAGFRIVCNYNTDLFNPTTIRRWLEHYRILLEAAAAAPASRLDALPLLADAQRSELIAAGSATQRFAPETCIHAMFENHARRTPDAIALTCEGRHLSYRDLDAAANRLARHLVSLGVQAETLVAVCLDRSPELMIAILAVLKAGGAYVPLDPDSPGARLELILADAQPCVLLTQEKLLSKTSGYTGEVFCVDRDGHSVTAPDATALQSAIKPESPAYVIYTSGSTGVPKGVVVTHYNVQRLFQATAQWFHFGERDVWTLFHSSAFDFSVWEMWGALCHGGRLVIVPYLVSRNPARFYELLAAEKVTVLNQTPLAFQQIIHVEDTPAARRELSLRYVIFGGEALDFATLRPWFDRHGDTTPQLVNMYGITETTVHVTYRPITAADLANHPGSRIGCAIPDLDLFVLDQNLAPCAIGVAGELHVGGAGVATGYLHQPELTAARFIPHPWKNGERLYKSGDLARRTGYGDIEYLGRCDLQVKIRGFRIELGEIESVMLKHPEIQQVAVVPQSDPNGENRLAAYAVRTPGAALNERDLRAFLRLHLPGYMVPSALVWLDALPMNHNGKLDVKALPAPDASEASASQAASTLLAPRNEIEKGVAQIWGRVLSRGSVSLLDDFFTVGGHSLLALRMLGDLRSRFGVEVPPQRLFETPTVEGLAQFISERMPAAAAPASSSLVQIQRGDASRPPLFLVPGGWGGEIEFLVYGELSRQIDLAFPIWGLKARGAGTGDAPHSSVIEMAADYLREVRRIQPHGPYLLAGECLGGLCAHEMARQLEQAGESVALLVLLDASVPTESQMNDVLNDYLNSETRKRDLEAHQNTLQQRVRNHLGKMSGLSLTEKFGYVFSKVARRGKAEPAGNSLEAEQRPTGQKDYPLTLLRHRLQRYDGTVTLLIDEETFRTHGDLGWESIPDARLQTHILPGTHLSYIRENAASTAAKLRELLREASFQLHHDPATA